MGPLMVLGAYFPFAIRFSWYPIALALPASMLIPALMVSNEMRDFMRDTNLSMGTLSVRIGHRASKMVYRILVFGAFALTIVFVLFSLYPTLALLVFLALPTAMRAHRSVTEFQSLGIPYTNSLHWKFTLLLILALILDTTLYH